MAEVIKRRTALCRGCEEPLTETSAVDPVTGEVLWHGPDGAAACIPAQYGRPPIRHMPLPEGFRGAPS